MPEKTIEGVISAKEAREMTEGALRDKSGEILNSISQEIRANAEHGYWYVTVQSKDYRAEPFVIESLKLLGYAVKKSTSDFKDYLTIDWSVPNQESSKV